VNSSRLSPLPYHEAIRDFLKREESAVWKWFASQATGGEQADAVRFDLLKKTYRIERSADPDLYALADEERLSRGPYESQDARPDSLRQRRPTLRHLDQLGIRCIFLPLPALRSYRAACAAKCAAFCAALVVDLRISR
jgi:hypothetical protein